MKIKSLLMVILVAAGFSACSTGKPSGTVESLHQKLLEGKSEYEGAD